MPSQDMPQSARRMKRRFELGEDILREMEELSLNDSRIAHLYHALMANPEGSAELALWSFAKIMTNTVKVMQDQLLKRFVTEPGPPLICLCPKCGGNITIKQVPGN